jgi:hypothetical protein
MLLSAAMALHAPTAGTPQAPPAAPTRFFKGSVVSSIGGIYNTDVMAGQKVSAQAGGRLNNDQISRAPPLDTDSARQHSTGMVIEGRMGLNIGAPRRKARLRNTACGAVL